jgi:hypothetical protein
MDRETGFHGPMAITGTTPRDLSDPALYVNREFSWLDFNARVLALAADPARSSRATWTSSSWCAWPA